MRFIEKFWTTIAYVLNWLTLTPDNGSGVPQHPIFGESSLNTDDGIHNAALASGPVFTPPSAPPGSGFTCDYSSMVGWKACTSSSNRGCWLQNADGRTYDINTDYEVNGPVGITRNYTLVLTDAAINADGMIFLEAKIFNNSFPGPWLQLCWGDRVNITVVNKLKSNGTSVHWHGIRQLLSNPMDGVRSCHI